MSNLNFPLSNIQLELLKLYSTDLSDEDMNELKDLLADFFAKKSINLANQTWKEKGLTNDDMERWLNEK
ncbi:MAG: hypothetical protein AAF573_12215 [Bacteroidota bacterium]